MTTTIWVPWKESAVYLDTSALIKRYVDEQGTQLVDQILQARLTSTDVVCENHRVVLGARTLAREGEGRSQPRGLPVG